MNERPDSEWEEQINALLDGELNDEQAQRLRAAAENDAALAGTIREAVQLRQAISNIPVDRAPSSLHRKLRSIPRQQQVHERSRFLQLRWGLVMATILVAVTIAVSQIGPSEPTAAEIAQARQELNLALTYLVKTSRRTRSEITSNIHHGFTRPVTDNTIRVISNQFGFNKE